MTRQLINENSVCVNLVKRMCKDLNINNPGEWGLYEVWDHPDLPEMPGMRERKIPNNEAPRQTILKWEVATRLRWGMVAAMPETSFRRAQEEHSLTNTRAKEELQLEYKQALINYQAAISPLRRRRARTVRSSLTASWRKGWTRCGTWPRAAPLRTFDKRLAEASAAEEEGRADR